LSPLVLLDLDRFKEVNDTFGHRYGDLLLRQLGPRMQPVMRQSDTIARLGGDEFALLLPNTDAAGGVTIAQKLQAALDKPFAVEGRKLGVDASIGIAAYPEHGNDATTLLRCADVAMYVSKRGNHDYAVYSFEQDTNSPDRLTLAGELRHAIDSGLLELHYQPKVDLSTGRIQMVEALVRWPHPEQGYIPPAEFIPLTEHTGLMKPLTHWVLNEALRQLREWQDGGHDMNIAVNLSASSLQDRTLVETISVLLCLWNVDPKGLAVEITESAIMVDPDHALEVLSRLHEIGVTIALDDFGTGYSSLAYLQRLPVQCIKIDRTFVLRMTTNKNDPVIVRLITDMSHALGLEVVAEGVEDQQTLDALRAIGCDMAQGYYLGRPMPPSKVMACLDGGDLRLSAVS